MQSEHYRLGAGSEPARSQDASVPAYKRNEQYELEWYQWSKKTGLQRCDLTGAAVADARGRRKDMSMVWKYFDIPGVLENLPGSGRRPYGPIVREASGLFEDPWVRLRNELDPQLQFVRNAYSATKV